MQRVWRTVTGFYHVCARGTGKQLIFECDDDRWEFLELMRDCCREEGVTVIAWCLMGNHVHLVLADYEDRMSAAMHRLLLTYARRFNKRTGRTGHLFQNSLSKPDGSEPALCDMKETEWERHAFADKMAKELGVPLRGVKAAPLAQRDTVIVGLNNAGFTVRQIERYTEIGKSTVSRIVRARARTAMRAGGNVM